MKHPPTSKIGEENVVHIRPLIKKRWKRQNLALQGNFFNMKSLLSLIFVYVWLCLHLFGVSNTRVSNSYCMGVFNVPYFNTPINLAIYNSD